MSQVVFAEPVACKALLPLTRTHDGLDRDRLDACFPRHSEMGSVVPVWCLTPGVGRTLHRFFDTSPISPGGRYAALFRMPFEDRIPRPGDAGHVVVVDLKTGQERVVAETRGWDVQLGCNLNWGSDDCTLVFNDVDVQTWTPQLVLLNHVSGAAERITGGVYHVSPDGRLALSASTEKMRRTQVGYGVWLPDEYVAANLGASHDDGLFITDLQTGARRLLLSLADAAMHIPELRDLIESEQRRWHVYGFHSKWASTGDRIIFTVRRFLDPGDNRFDAFSHGPMVRFDVLTLRPDGTDIYNAVPASRWELGGHHINFFPDGSKLSLNLRLAPDREMDLVQVNLDGSGECALTGPTLGSGHPTVHPNGTHILTDTYTSERWTVGDTTPLRWIDRRNGTEREVARFVSRPPIQTIDPLRLDPHPAWDRSWRYVTFNAIHGGTRRVFLADFDCLI